MAKTKIKDGYYVFDDLNERPVHRWKAERKYKENLEGKEVHHINGDKLNNEDTNLIALSKEDHFQIHLYNRKLSLAFQAIVYLSISALISVFLGNILNNIGLIWASRILILLIFIISFEARYNFIGNMLRRPDSKIGE
jgi:hypothetical protein